MYALRDRIGEESVKFGVSKYKNIMGITCYMNSILHILQQTPVFVEYISQAKFRDGIVQKINKKISSKLLLIGDGPEMNSLKLKSENYSRVIFHGEILDMESIGKMLFASDMMLIPGYVGLAVVHAFAYGCPVITTKTDLKYGPFHSPEFEYIIEGKNGFFLKGEIQEYTKKLLEIIKEKESLKQISLNAENTALNEAGLNIFVSGFRNAINFVK